MSGQRTVTKRLLVFKRRRRVHVERSQIMIGRLLVESFQPVRENSDVRHVFGVT